MLTNVDVPEEEDGKLARDTDVRWQVRAIVARRLGLPEARVTFLDVNEIAREHQHRQGRLRDLLLLDDSEFEQLLPPQADQPGRLDDSWRVFALDSAPGEDEGEPDPPEGDGHERSSEPDADDPEARWCTSTVWDTPRRARRCPKSGTDLRG